MSVATVINGDARRLPLADGSVHMACTSPPYFGLRDYGVAGQIGLEATPDEFVAAMVAVFREVRRVLRDDGTCWLNLGDSYASTPPGCSGVSQSSGLNGARGDTAYRERLTKSVGAKRNTISPGLKPKDLIGIPWRVALALQADGWYLRDAIIWSKAEVDDDDVLEGSAMPGSQRDRCTSAYEMVFQLAKSERYYFDAEAVKSKSGAMPRNVWRINPSPWKGAHFATFPPALVERCVKAGTSEKGVCPKCSAPWERVVERERLLDGHRPVAGGWAQDEAGRIGANGVGHWRITSQASTLGWRPTCECEAGDPIPATVLDCFAGSGTTGVVATGLGRRFVGIDLSADYCRMAVRRISRPHAGHRTPRKAEPLPLFAGVDE